MADGPMNDQERDEAIRELQNRVKKLEEENEQRKRNAGTVDGGSLWNQQQPKTIDGGTWS